MEPWYSVRRSIQAFLSEVHQKMHQGATPLETMTWIAEVTASAKFNSLVHQACSGVDSGADLDGSAWQSQISTMSHEFAQLVAENWQDTFQVPTSSNRVMVVAKLSWDWVESGLWKPRYRVGNPSTIGDLRHANSRIKMCNYSRCRLNTELVPELSIFARQHPDTSRVKSGFSRCPQCKVSYCSQACRNGGEHRCETNIYMTDMLNEIHNLICYKDETNMEKQEEKEEGGKVIMVTIRDTHDTQPPTWEVDRVKLALPAACPNLRRAVVQQDLCTGNERLLLLKYEAKNCTFVQSRVCKSILYEWMGQIVGYYRFYRPWWTVEEEEEL
jgi:hypothetical protein